MLQTDVTNAARFRMLLAEITPQQNTATLRFILRIPEQIHQTLPAEPLADTVALGRNDDIARGKPLLVQVEKRGTFAGDVPDHPQLPQTLEQLPDTRHGIPRTRGNLLLIHPDKKYLQYCQKEIETYLGKLRLELNEKTNIFPLRHGVDFLGFHTYITESGQIVRKLRRSSLKAMSGKIRKWKKDYPAGKVTQIKSKVSEKQNQRDTLRSLGLKRIGDTTVRPDDAQTRGYVKTVAHLVKVEEID